MPEYTLRNVDPSLWSRFTERANREGWPIRPLIVALLDGYARGDITPGSLPPVDLPQFAWLRAHYRQIAKQPGFAALEPLERWDRLVRQVLNTPAGGEWHSLDEVPTFRRLQVVDWLHRTSNLPPAPHELSLRAIAHIGEGADLKQNRRAFQYEVLGLPPGQQAWIADYSGGWRILRVIDGVTGEWGKPHLTKDEALSTLAAEIQKTT